MSRLIRLYPAVWRTRYEDELIELLGRRPVTLSDRMDLARGAIDAHLHPQLADRVPQPWTHRIPGLLALTAGLLWAWSFAFLAFWADPDADWGNGIGIALVIMLISLPGDYTLNHGRRIAIGVGLVVGGFILARVLPWNVADGLLNLLVGMGVWLVAAAGLLTLAAIRAEVGAKGRWLMVLGAVALPALVGAPVIIGLASLESPFTPIFAFFVPYGLSWAACGVRMVIRGAPTVSDLPNQTGPLASSA